MSGKARAPQPVASAVHTGKEHAQAMKKAAAKEGSRRISVPFLGTIELPPPGQLAFLGGIVTLGVTGVVDWPIVAVLVTGHVLANNRHTQFLRDFGKALEQA